MYAWQTIKPPEKTKAVAKKTAFKVIGCRFYSRRVLMFTATREQADRFGWTDMSELGVDCATLDGVFFLRFGPNGDVGSIKTAMIHGSIRVLVPLDFEIPTFEYELKGEQIDEGRFAIFNVPAWLFELFTAVGTGAKPQVEVPSNFLKVKNPDEEKSAVAVKPAKVLGKFPRVEGNVFIFGSNEVHRVELTKEEAIIAKVLVDMGTINSSILIKSLETNLKITTGLATQKLGDLLRSLNTKLCNETEYCLRQRKEDNTKVIALEIGKYKTP